MTTTSKADIPFLFSPRGTLLFILSSLAILCIFLFSIISYQKQSALKQQHLLTNTLKNDINRHLENSFSETCKALAKQKAITNLFTDKQPATFERATSLLNSTKEILGASIVYILDRKAITLASSYIDQGESLVGNNYEFRPYYLESIKGKDYSYPALGVTTGKRGIYFSSPIRSQGEIVGVAVIKGNLDGVDAILEKVAAKYTAAVISDDGVVFASTNPQWLFKTTSSLSQERRIHLISSGQYADQPLVPLNIDFSQTEIHYNGKKQIIHKVPLVLHGYQILTLYPEKSLFLIIFAACLLYAIPVYFFYLRFEHMYSESQYKIKIDRQNVHLKKLNDEMAKEIAEKEHTAHKLSMVSEQELQYRLLFESSKDAITIVDKAGNFIQANQAYLSMMDCTSEDLKSMKAKDFWHNEEERRSWFNLIEKQGSIIDYRSQQVTKNGTLLDLTLTTNATQTKEGKTVYLSILRDITDQLQDQKELIEAKISAEDANLAKSEFLANMSHEIRTPMNGIIGMTNILLDSKLTENQQRYLEMVKSSADRLLDIINNILDFSKIEAGRLELEEIQFNLPEKIDDLYKLMALKAESKNVHLKTHVGADIPWLLLGDPTRLMQVLINLTSNAIKFTEDGEVLVSVEKQDSKSTNEILLLFTVKDTGIGVPEEKQRTIFESFSQADTSTTREYGGTGLGLAISSQICKLMGGEIGVDSKQGEGSKFHFTALFTIPDTTGSQQQSKHGTVISSELTREEIFKDIKLLLAEDDYINRTLALTILHQAHLQVATVENGDEALKELEKNHYDLILMDIQMPEMDGFEATRIIRKKEQDGAKHIPIVAMTAHAIKGDKEKCLDAGMDDYIAKPINPFELYNIIENHLLYRVLVADDHPISLKLAGRIFTEMGWQVTLAENSKQCSWECTHSSFDLIIIDLMMKDLNLQQISHGIQDKMNQTGKTTYICGISVALDTEQREHAFTAGFHECIEKPLTKKRASAVINTIKSFR